VSGQQKNIEHNLKSYIIVPFQQQENDDEYENDLMKIVKCKNFSIFIIEGRKFIIIPNQQQTEAFLRYTFLPFWATKLFLIRNPTIAPFLLEERFLETTKPVKINLVD